MAKPSEVCDASFARSFDPFTSSSRQHRARKLGMVRRSRKHRGRANLREVGGTDTGVNGNGRCAARRAAPALARGHRVPRQKRKGVMASVPARIEELGFGNSHVVTQLQKSSGDEWSRIRSANALQKERPCRVNRGLARSEGRRVAPSASASSESVVAGRAHRLNTGEDRLKAQGGGRPSFSGGTIAQAVTSSRDRGCNDHRILRRAPDDGRHPGSFPCAPFTRSTTERSRRSFASSDPRQSL
jgi:hypothetical protein